VAPAEKLSRAVKERGADRDAAFCETEASLFQRNLKKGEVIHERTRP
jgi:hypothetical protein